ncbi:MAG: zinc ribbon domain-containing protein [Acholeplasmataceae bacterium]|nr:zinc ribbon domain-containing protein [Acholeplasmataceae bacterium]
MQFTDNYLNHSLVKNIGQIPQYYVENSHPAIIDKGMWELVQIEHERRRSMRTSYSSTDIFSTKLVCSDCGSFYGRKKWYAGSKYERYVYRCNHRYNEGKARCKTPHLYEKEIKEQFLEAYNITMQDKKRIESDLKAVIKLITNTKGIDKEITQVNNELVTISDAINKLIQDNSKSNKGIDKFEKKAKELKNKYEDLKIKRDELIDTKRLNLAKSYRMKTFLKSIEKSDDKLKCWNDSIWMLMVESATVYRDKRIKFKFYNGIVEK